MAATTPASTETTKKDKPKYAPGPNDPKLFNTIVIWDVYTVARTPEEARACVEDWIRNQDLAPSESVALPVMRETEVREAWRNEKPLVANDITDEEFESIVKGHTALEVFEHFYKR